MKRTDSSVLNSQRQRRRELKQVGIQMQYRTLCKVYVKD